MTWSATKAAEERLHAKAPHEPGKEAEHPGFMEVAEEKKKMGEELAEKLNVHPRTACDTCHR